DQTSCSMTQQFTSIFCKTAFPKMETGLCALLTPGIPRSLRQNWRQRAVCLIRLVPKRTTLLPRLLLSLNGDPSTAQLHQTVIFGRKPVFSPALLPAYRDMEKTSGGGY